MAPQTMNTYGFRIWLTLAVVAGPALQAYLHFGTIDTYPYVIPIAIGGAVSALTSVLARRRSRDVVPVRGGAPNPGLERKQAKWCIRYLGPPLWAFAVALVANRLFDNSPPSDHEVRLLKFVARKKGPSTIHVESWRYPGETESLRYDWRTMSEVSSATALNRVLIASTRKGAFGWAWVQGVRPATR